MLLRCVGLQFPKFLPNVTCKPTHLKKASVSHIKLCLFFSACLREEGRVLNSCLKSLMKCMELVNHKLRSMINYTDFIYVINVFPWLDRFAFLKIQVSLQVLWDSTLLLGAQVKK